MTDHPNSLRLLFLALGALVAAGAAQAASDGDAVDAGLRAAFARARTERVAVIALGDSNQRFGGQGYSFFMARALGAAFGCYGTDFTVYRPWHDKDGPAPSPAPEALAAQAFGGWYVAPGQTARVSWKNGQVIVPADHPLDVSGPLRFHLDYGTFGPGMSGGTFHPAVRRDESPWTTLASAPGAIDPCTGSFGVTRYAFDLPADPARRWPVQFMPEPVSRDLPGPFFASLASCENTARQTGIAYYTLYASGGKSVRDMVLKLRSLTPARADEFFHDILSLLNGRRTGVVMICSGLNDRNNRGPSLGPAAGLDSSTAPGYADNLEALVGEIDAIWQRCGGEAGALHFAFMPSHALGDPDDARLVSYREAARSLAKRLPNASVIDLSRLVPYAEMKAGHYYYKGSLSAPHLSPEGYAAISAALVRELVR